MPKINTTPLYLSSLTPLRGIAALWVVIFHLDVSIYYRQLGTLIPHEVTGLITKGYLWVDFFFILSGFIIAHVYGEKLVNNLSRATIASYLWARFSRLYPLHLFTLLILIVLSSAVPLGYPQVVDDSWKTYFDWSALHSQLIFTNAMNQHVYLSWNIVSWSIGAEWWTYFAGILLLPLINRRRNTIATLTIILAFGLLAGLVCWRQPHTLDITFDYGFYRCLFEFTTGIALYQLYLNRTGKSWLANDVTFLMLSLAILAVFHWDFNDLVIIPIYGTLILAASYNDTLAKKLLNKPLLQYLGKISFSIYLVHSVWLMVFWYLLPQLNLISGDSGMPVTGKVLYVLVFMALTVACSHFTYHYVEVKSRNIIRNLVDNFRLTKVGMALKL